MKTKVQISISYFNNGKAITHTHTIESFNTNLLFDNAVQDANQFAHMHDGQVSITRTVNGLYINYLGVKCDLIDRMYLISKP